jgi:hypothetical protein
VACAGLALADGASAEAAAEALGVAGAFTSSKPKDNSLPPKLTTKQQTNKNSKPRMKQSQAKPSKEQEQEERKRARERERESRVVVVYVLLPERTSRGSVQPFRDLTCRTGSIE